MSILETIIGYKKQELEFRKKAIPIEQLQQSQFFRKNRRSLAGALQNKDYGVITEFKRRSPSKPHINPKANLLKVVKGYEQAGAAAISVLTDSRFFGGSGDDLILSRVAIELPILRKDFIADAYQLYEARAWGADAVLLIAAALPTIQLKELAHQAKELGLEVLLEVHNEKELEQTLNQWVDMVGINNRNLKTFEVDLNISFRLAELIPAEFIKISESGLQKPESIISLQQAGYQGFLMGERFMKNEDPGAAADSFIESVNKLLTVKK